VVFLPKSQIRSKGAGFSLCFMMISVTNVLGMSFGKPHKDSSDVVC